MQGVVAPNGTQQAVIRPSQGLVISNAQGLDVLTVGYQKQGNLALVMNDGTVNRVMLGVFPDGSIGMIITKEFSDCYDVLS